MKPLGGPPARHPRSRALVEVARRLWEITSWGTLPALRSASRIIRPASSGSLVRLPAQERDKGPDLCRDDRHGLSFPASAGGRDGPGSRILLLAVMLGVGFGRFPSMVGGMEVVSMGHVGVVRGLLVIAGLMVLRRFRVVVRCVLVVFGGLQVMSCCFF